MNLGWNWEASTLKAGEPGDPLGQRPLLKWNGEVKVALNEDGSVHLYQKWNGPFNPSILASMEDDSDTKGG